MGVLLGRFGAMKKPRAPAVALCWDRVRVRKTAGSMDGFDQKRNGTCYLAG
jgi:hypothetical protein